MGRLGKSRQVADDGKILESRLLAPGLGKSRQVADDGKSLIPGYWQLG